jgi:hypothetical protein
MKDEFNYDPIIETGEEPVVEEDEFFQYNEDSINLAIDFGLHREGQEALKKLADQVVDDFDRAWESTECRRQRIADDYKIFTGDLPPKTFPFKDSANAHIPIMLENSTRMINRIAFELFGDWSATHGVVPIGPGDESQADILTKHGNWQIRNQITDFRRQMMRGLTLYITTDGVVAHSRWDDIKKRNVHEVLTSDEFVIPYTMVSTEPDMSDLPYKMQVMRLHRHELQKMRGIWENVDSVIKHKPPPWDDTPDAPLRSSAAESTMIEVPDGQRFDPYKIIQYEGWTDNLPNQVNDRYVKMIVDHNTRTVMHLSIHEEEDWQDRQRYELQMQELMQFRQEKEMFDSTVMEMSKAEEGAKAILMSETAGEMERAQASIDLDTVRVTPLPPPPLPPGWMQNPEDPDELPEDIKRVPIHMYSHAVCIEPVVGTHGLSYGAMLADLNRAANVAMSQFIDAATLGNCWSGLVSDDFDTNGRLEISPGKMNKVKGMTGDDIRKAFVELRPAPANPQLIEVVRMCQEMAQNAVQAPDVLSGAEGKSGETYRGHSARIEQATIQLGTIARNFAHFFEQVLKNNAKLNSIYLPDEEMINIAARPGTGVDPITVRRDMYKRNYQVEIRSDLRFTSMAQRVAEADEIVALVSNNPVLAMNTSLLYQAVKKSLIARQKQDLVPFLGPPPPPPPVPMAIPVPPMEGEPQ